MAWHFRHNWSGRRNTFSPRVGVALVDHLGDQVFQLLRRQRFLAPNVSPPALVSASSSPPSALPEMRTLRTPTLATSCGSFLSASAFASRPRPALAPQKRLEDLVRALAALHRRQQGDGLLRGVVGVQPGQRHQRRAADVGVGFLLRQRAERLDALLAAQRRQPLDRRLPRFDRSPWRPSPAPPVSAARRRRPTAPPAAPPPGPHAPRRRRADRRSSSPRRPA